MILPHNKDSLLEKFVPWNTNNMQNENSKFESENKIWHFRSKGSSVFFHDDISVENSQDFYFSAPISSVFPFECSSFISPFLFKALCTKRTCFTRMVKAQSFLHSPICWLVVSWITINTILTLIWFPVYYSCPGSRRGSSQSEQLEVEVYNLGKDFSRSLPGSRRSSFQSAQEQADQDIPAVPPPSSYSRDRRRSSCTRMLRDPEEILKSLKAVKGELGRTMSFAGDKRSRRKYSIHRED